jgi:hypothetical protein
MYLNEKMRRELIKIKKTCLWNGGISLGFKALE